jgi:hypothetical protein
VERNRSTPCKQKVTVDLRDLTFSNQESQQALGVMIAWATPEIVTSTPSTRFIEGLICNLETN